MLYEVPSQEGMNTQDEVVEYLHTMYEFYANQSYSSYNVKGPEDPYALEARRDATKIADQISRVDDTELAQSFVQAFMGGNTESRWLSSELARQYATAGTISQDEAIACWNTLIQDEDERVVARAKLDSRRYLTDVALQPLNHNELGNRRMQRLYSSLGHQMVRPLGSA